LARYCSANQSSADALEEVNLSVDQLAPPPSAIAGEIIALHGEIITAARTSLDKAVRIGELLVEQKARLHHGRWLPWIKEHLPFSQQTASNYIRVYSNRAKLPTVGNLELTDAYRLLAAPAEPERKPRSAKTLPAPPEPDDPPHVVARVDAMPAVVTATPPPPSLASPIEQLRREIQDVERQIRELKTKESELRSKLRAAILLSANAVHCSDENCGAVFEDVSEAVTLYECQECGDPFTEDDSADGCSHRCPSCNKFAAKLTDNGCPECSRGELIKQEAKP
jgi:5-methylcytosine-specific restriction endonuclease McrA